MIDDDGDVIATVQDHLQDTFGDIVFQSRNDFDDGIQAIQDVKPDVVILDWYRGNPAVGEAAGADTWSFVWNEWFCPIVIYSAGDVELEGQVAEGHPFVRVVAKGGGTEATVAKHIAAYAPQIKAIRHVDNDVSRVTREVLRHLASLFFSAEQDDARRQDMLARAARRRIAAIMDDLTCLGGQLAHTWEMYIFPVLTSHPTCGDILRLAGTDPQLADSYRVVLTPTCDMVPQGAANACKVANILVARCCTATLFAENGMSLASNTAVKKVKEKLGTALNEPHQSGFILLPECPGSTPILAVNLRELEMIPIGSIANASGEGINYLRIVSLDSPFREQLAWAYLQIACRPGLPPRNFTSLIDAFGEKWGQ